MGALITDMSLMQVAFTSSTPRSSVMPQLKGCNEIHIEGLEEFSSITSHPSSFQTAVEDFLASSPKHEENVSNR